MYKLFGVLIASFVFSGLLAVPFINLLYKIKFRYKLARTADKSATTLSQLHKSKAGTPTGGGILIVFSSIIFALMFYLFTSYNLNWTAVILFLTMILFSILGLYDDSRKMIRIGGRRIKSLPWLPKFILQILVGIIISYLLYEKMGLNSIKLPVLDSILNINPINLGMLYIPFAAFVIVSSSNAFNITDGLDGLATGLLLIALAAFWALSSSSAFSGDIVLFVAVMMGALLAFLYFNIFPARIFMGDTGSLALGAMLAVVALMSGHPLILPVIGGVFVVELLSSLIQIFARKFLKRRIFNIAPLHFHFQANGWDETKVTTRFWLFGAILAFIGLFIATFKV